MDGSIPNSFTVPAKLDAAAINDAEIENDAKLDTTYGVSDNVTVKYDDAVPPTQMRLSYSPTTHPTVKFRGESYKPTAVIYYHGSDDASPIHGWTGVNGWVSVPGVKGEVVIEHTSDNGKNTLYIHIMTVGVDDIARGVSKAAEIFQDRGSGGTPPPFTANDILPKKPFLFYVNGTTTSIVIIPSHSCYIEIPIQYLKKGNGADRFSSASLYNSDGDIKYRYSSELPTNKGTQLMDQDIYIDCNPVGAGEEVSPTKMWDEMQGGLPGSDPNKQNTKNSGVMIYMVLLSIIIPLVLVCIFWFVFKKMTEYLRYGSTASSTTAINMSA